MIIGEEVISSGRGFVLQMYKKELWTEHEKQEEILYKVGTTKQNQNARERKRHEITVAYNN